MKKLHQYILLFLSISSFIVMNGCEKKELVVMPVGLQVSPQSAGLGALITIRGNGLNKIQKVLFGSSVAIFNPVYNTDSVFLLRVPAEASFGSQKITLINAGGDATMAQIDFKVLQPKPSVIDVQPRASSAGELLTITGLNFTGKGFSPELVVKIGSDVAEIVSKDKDKIVVKMPSGQGGLVSVTTGNVNIGGGTFESTILIASEKVFHMIADFDGGGSSDKSYWYTYGDVDGPWTTSNTEPAQKSGKFMKMTNLKGTNKNGYVGASHDDAIVYDLSQVVTTSTAVRLDVNNNGKKATILSVAFADKDGGNWFKTVKCDWDGWQPVTIKLTDLNFWYGTKKGDKIDGKRIARVVVGFDSYKDIASELNIDNIRLIEYK
jgi:IPT/TIG domain/Carbohydrate binding domain (family 11)